MQCIIDTLVLLRAVDLDHVINLDEHESPRRGGQKARLHLSSRIDLIVAS